MIYEVKEIKLDYSKISAPNTGYVPKMKVFIPNTEDEVSRYTPKRPTVLVLPGGGYAFTSEREAEPIALHFLERGMNACILYYSVAPAVYPVSLLESLSAIKYIRENADKWFADKDKIYVCGFSAGGHLAASVGTHWNKKESAEYFDELEDVKPNGLILAYPVIINDDGLCHKGSFDNLLGEKKDDKAMQEYVCLDKQVSKTTPPTFIWSTFEDTCVPCESTLKFAAALRKNGVPFEMHIYEKGGHGGSTGDLVTNGGVSRFKSWLNEACDWVADTRTTYSNVK
ncbi:MAG: alpha/beta hydrolase [Eubacteriales bacterium]|nr:alpha/beta hydrolase [Eubacteriales bacterium]